MPDSSAAKMAWIVRVLGVALPATARAASSTTKLSGSARDAGQPADGTIDTPTGDLQTALKHWNSAVLAWQTASDLVDKQMNDLAAAMRKTGHPVLTRIADLGLNGVTGDNKVPLMAAIGDIGQGDAGKLAKGRAKALETVRAFQKHLSDDPRVAVCEANPLGVAVSMRATLGDALKQMEAALRTSASLR